MTEMESRVRDKTDESMEPSGFDIRHVVVEEQRLGVNHFDAGIGGSENVASVAHSNTDDIVTGGPSEDTKDELKHPVSGIVDKSDSQNGSTGKTMLRMDGGSNSGESLQMVKASLRDSRNVMHDDHASHNDSVGSWSLGCGFEMGDMVWGKVKSHPWWPGQIFNEAFASSSVRRTKKDGQVLVAFFGDSSYGWFDPAELIPYEPHFIEKSQQSTSRNFVKAVEESVDEACRRSALGLTCFCRNPYNFRPTNVPGQMAVDVFDYEPGGIYSNDQIQKARDNFQPERTLSFVEQLAAAPQEVTTSLAFDREKAVALAFRRAVFEEFDETYAQAFGQEPVRPTVAPPPSVDQSVQANLSGPLVIAESLRGHRGSTKAVKSREQSKKDKYLFKRRDERGDMGASHTGQGNSSSSSPYAFEDRQSPAATGDYVFQRRDQAVVGRDQPEGATSGKDAGAPSSLSLSKAVTAGNEVLRHPRPSTDQERAVAEDTGAVKESGPTKKSKKAGALKGAPKRLSAEKSDLGEKKKKRRKTTDSPGSSDQFQKHSSASHVIGASGKGDLPGKPMQIGTPSRTDSQPKGISTGSASEQVPVVRSGAGADAVPAENKESKVQQVLADLKVLALNPLHGRDRNRPALARQVFLKFRSLVFQKSLPAVPPSASGDKEAFEARSGKIGGAGTSSYPPGESTRSAAPSRPPKPLGRTDDPTRGGKKRVLSERQEDVATKRAKKLSALKSSALSTEKRKAPELQHPDGKGKGLAAGQMRIGTKMEPTGKVQPPKARVKEPTFLVMRYPFGTSLPSSAELKARFGRFGPMDTSQLRVFYSTNSCRILFHYKEDAESALRFAVGNKTSFGNVKVSLKRHLAAPDPQATDKPNRPGEEIHVDQLQPTPSPVQPSPSVQLKSCLKKPAGDEGGNQNSGGVRGVRVRFNMGETRGASASGSGVSTMDPRTNNSSSLPEASSGSSSSLSVAMDVRNNQQKVLSKHPLQPPLVSPPVQFPLHPSNVEVAPKSQSQHHTHTRLPPPPPPPVQVSPPIQAPPPAQVPPPPPVDISQEMLSLLTRCHDVVANVKSILGYVPYRPL